jgi:hypothetical protein
MLGLKLWLGFSKAAIPSELSSFGKEDLRFPQVLFFSLSNCTQTPTPCFSLS